MLKRLLPPLRTSRLARRPGGGGEEGQATLEFILIIPFLLAFFLLMVDLGLMTYHYVSMSNSVREAARYGAVNCTNGTCTPLLIAQRAVDRSGGIMSDTGDVEVHWEDATGDGMATGRGDAVVVKATYTYNFLFFPASIDVYSCSDMRLEQQDRGSGLPTGTGGC